LIEPLFTARLRERKPWRYRSKGKMHRSTPGTKCFLQAVLTHRISSGVEKTNKKKKVENYHEAACGFTT
jgi:hypothetical protein